MSNRNRALGIAGVIAVVATVLFLLALAGGRQSTEVAVATALQSTRAAAEEMVRATDLAQTQFAKGVEDRLTATAESHTATSTPTSTHTPTFTLTPTSTLNQDQIVGTQVEQGMQIHETATQNVQNVVSTAIAAIPTKTATPTATNTPTSTDTPTQTPLPTTTATATPKEITRGSLIVRNGQQEQIYAVYVYVSSIPVSEKTATFMMSAENGTTRNEVQVTVDCGDKNVRFNWDNQGWKTATIVSCYRQPREKQIDSLAFTYAVVFRIGKTQYALSLL